MSISTGAWEKYKTPPDIITVENKLKTLKLTAEQQNELLMTVLDANISNATTKAEKKAWSDLKVKRKSKTMVKRLEEAFIEEFNLWLHGRSKYNKVSEEKTRFVAEVAGHGAVVENYVKHYTPWGNKPLTFLPDVQKYLEGPILNRDHVIKVLTKLKLTGPRNIDEAWVYYKYIVRNIGII